MGKIDKWRDCPAVGRRIKPIECGQNRGRVYPCPPDCPHCPWTVANYDHLLAIEGSLDEKTMGFYRDLVGGFSARTNLDVDLLEEGFDGRLEFQGNCYREFFLREHQPGKRLFDLWRESGWTGLVRDEPFLMEFKTQTRPCLLEVQRIVDDLQVECRNLLDDEESGVFTVCDRGLASSALQFQCFIAWMARFPFFSRMHGIAFPLPPGRESGRDFLLRHMREMGGPEDGKDRQTAWLGENFFKLRNRIVEEDKKSMQSMLRSTDFKDCVAVYRLKGREADLKLESREDFRETPPDADELQRRGAHRSFVWLRTGESKKWEAQLPEAMQGGQSGPGIPIWGQIRIFDTRVEISASSENLFRPLREMAGVFFGDLLEWEKESVVDLAKQKWPEDGAESGTERLAITTSFVPGDVTDTDALMQGVFREHYRKFLEDRIPALDNLTPREAAARPDMRDRLVALMKGHLQTMDGHSKQDGRVYDIGWVLDELGLAEMKTPARRLTPPAFQKDWWEEVDEKTLTKRLADSIKNPEACRNLEDFPEMAWYFEDISPTLLNAQEVDALVLLVNLAIGILVPPDGNSGRIVEDEMYRETDGVFSEITPDETSGSPEKNPAEKLIENSAQPAFLEFALTLLLAVTSGTKSTALFPMGKNIRPENIIPILVQIEAFLRCLRRSALG